MPDELIVYRLPGVGAFVIRKSRDSKLFLTTPDAVIISPDVFINILRALVKKDLLDFRILEGILEEINSI
jgi:hypothetical protein